MVSVPVEILEITCDVIGAPQVVSKKPTSCCRTACKYFVHNRYICLSAARAQQNPSIGVQNKMVRG